MSYERPGQGFYVPAATKAVFHGAPATEHGVVGVAIKQKAKGWAEGLTSNYARIEVNEPFHIRTKGVREVAIGSGTPGVGIAAGVLGGNVYIRSTTNALILEDANAAGDLPYGKIVELPAVAGRGVATGFMRIDLDQKDTLPDAA